MWEKFKSLNELEQLHETIRLVMVVYLCTATAFTRSDIFREYGYILIFSSLVYLLVPLASAQLVENGDPLNWALSVADVVMTSILYWVSGGGNGYGLPLYFIAVLWATTRYPQPQSVCATMIVAGAYLINFFPGMFDDPRLLFHIMGVVVGLMSLGTITYSLAEFLRAQTLERKKKEMLLKELKASFQQQASVTTELEKTNVQMKQHALALEQSRMELIKRNRDLGLLAEILKIMGTTLELHELLRDSLEKTVELMEAQRGIILLRDEVEPEVYVETEVGFSQLMERKVRFQRGAGSVLGIASEAVLVM